MWLLLVEQLGKPREPAALAGWIATTTHRECLRVLTAARKSERLGTGLIDALQFVDNTIIDEEISWPSGTRRYERRSPSSSRCQRLLAMLTSDPPFSYAEISATLQIPMGSIGSPVDEIGCFVVDPIPSSPVRIRCRTEDGTDVLTGWVTL